MKSLIPNLNIILLVLFLAVISAICVLRVYFWYIDSELLKIEDCCSGVLKNHPRMIYGMQQFELQGVVFRTSVFPEYQLGDYLEVEIEQSSQRNVEDIDLREWNVFYYPKVTKDETKNDIFMNLISDFRNIIISRARAIFPEPHASLLLGMLVGFREDFPEDFHNLLRRSGTVHIIVVSGYHVSLVLTLTAVLFIRFGRYVYITAAVLILGMFILIVGLNPPAIRAAIMGIIGVFALIKGEQSNSFYMLFLAGCMMVIFDPSYLFNLSFQLSFVATSSIIFIVGLTRQWGLIYTQMAVSSGVNLALLPLLSFYFGQFSLIGILANVLIVFVVPFIAIIGAISIILDNFITTFISIVLIDYYLAVISILDSTIPLAFEYHMGFSELVLYYVVLFALSRFLHKILIQGDKLEDGLVKDE